jgi:hypothetical protein
MKLMTQTKNFYKRNTALSIGIIGAVAYVALQKKGMMPSLAPAPVKRATSAPVARYAYDTYAPIRNEPYTNTSHFFGPADGDPVFYGF